MGAFTREVGLNKAFVRAMELKSGKVATSTKGTGKMTWRTGEAD